MPFFSSEEFYSLLLWPPFMRPAQYIKLNISIQTISVPLTNLLLIYSEDPPLRVWICESTYVCMGNHLNPAGGPIALSSIVSTPIPALYAVRLVMLVSMCASAPPALPFALGAGVPLRLLCLVSGLSFSFFFERIELSTSCLSNFSVSFAPKLLPLGSCCCAADGIWPEQRPIRSVAASFRPKGFPLATSLTQNGNHLARLLASCTCTKL